MYCFLAFFLAILAPPGPSAVFLQDQGLSSLVEGVERSFARMKDFSSDFIQIFEDPLNRKQQESGHLYLMRSRMMRWEYKSPEEKLFVSDGKTVYFYVPADRQVNKEAVKQSFDDRIPLMFLLGQSNLRNEFTRFELLNRKPFFDGTKVVRMYPKRKTDLQEVVMEVDLRSIAAANLDDLDSQLRRAIAEATSTAGVECRIELMGERPSGVTPMASPIVQAALEVTRRFGFEPLPDVGSTDANLPISMGIPAIALGGGGSSGNVHTPEEWFDPSRREQGVQRLLALVAVLAGLN